MEKFGRRVKKMLTKEEILRKIEENKEKIKEYGVKRIGIFGSFVSGEQKEGSDLDFVVEFEVGGKSYNNFINLVFFLEGLFDKKVDLLTREGVKSIRIKEVRESIEKSVEYEANIRKNRRAGQNN